jgi:hypothetical protein
MQKNVALRSQFYVGWNWMKFLVEKRSKKQLGGWIIKKANFFWIIALIKALAATFLIVCGFRGAKFKAVNFL